MPDEVDIETIKKNIMKLFSERYGYVNPSKVIIREDITLPIQNAICSCYDALPEIFQNSGIYWYLYQNQYAALEHNVWTYFLNRRDGEFQEGNRYFIVSTLFLEDKSEPWYRKLDLVEFTIQYLRALDHRCDKRYYVSNAFIGRLNSEFNRLNFAYRVVDGKIVEITSEEEIKAVETALAGPDTQIRLHLCTALELYAKRPDGDYRNSIKESISAVEAYCRERTGKNTLGDAIKELKNRGVVLHPILNDSLTKLYAYTNQPDTGVRHSLMDDSDGYTPGADEALFMLVACSAFINYLRKK